MTRRAKKERDRRNEEKHREAMRLLEQSDPTALTEQDCLDLERLAALPPVTSDQEDEDRAAVA